MKKEKYIANINKINLDHKFIKDCFNHKIIQNKIQINDIDAATYKNAFKKYNIWGCN